MELSVEKLRAIPTLYPSTTWVVAHVYTTDYPGLCELIKQTFSKKDCPIRSTIIPHWVTTEYDHGEKLSICPIFPGYIFIDLEAPAKNWTTFNEIDGVLQILPQANEGKEPHLLTPEEVVHIISLTSSSLRLLSPQTNQMLGREVVITEGILKGLCGKVVEDGHELKIELRVSTKVLGVRIDRSKIAVKEMALSEGEEAMAYEHAR